MQNQNFNNYRAYRGPRAVHDDQDHQNIANLLMEAEEVKSDPKVMSHVNRKLSKMKGHIDSIDALRQLGRAEPLANNDGDDPKLQSPLKKARTKADRTQKPG